MKNINTTHWQEFQFTDLFDIVKGTRLTKANMKPGDINYIGATAFNNGVTAKIGNSDHIHPAGTITVCYNGSVGQTFYQTEPFWATDDVNVLYPHFTLNSYIAKYLCAVIYKLGQKYAYIDKWTAERMEETMIKLPATTQHEPDWEYMENYMRHIEDVVHRNIDLIINVSERGKRGELNTTHWQEFRVGDLFMIKPTKAYKYTNSKLLDNGKTPVVVNSAFNNGIGGYSTLPSTEKGNMVTFSDTVDANTIFYQEHDFIGYPHVQGLYPIGEYKNYWTMKRLKFFVSVFRKAALTKGFDYGNKFQRDIAKELHIKLPVTSDNNPDWEYMDCYMQKIEEKVKNDILLLSNALR